MRQYVGAIRTWAYTAIIGFHEDVSTSSSGLYRLDNKERTKSAIDDVNFHGLFVCYLLMVLAWQTAPSSMTQLTVYEQALQMANDPCAMTAVISTLQSVIFFSVKADAGNIQQSDDYKNLLERQKLA